MGAGEIDASLRLVEQTVGRVLAGASLFDRTSLANLETASPKYRVVAGAVWTVGKLSITLREALYGPSSGMSSRTGCPITPASPTCYETKIKAAVITDLEASYQLTDAVRFTVGANNLFNSYPDRVNALLRDDYYRNNSNGYVTQFPTFSPFGINGGYYYSKLTLVF